MMTKKRKRRGLLRVKRELVPIADRLHGIAGHLVNSRESASGRALFAELDRLKGVMASLPAEPTCAN